MKVELNVPKKYQKYFDRLEAESGLIDDCPYMLYFAEGYAYMGGYSCLPVKSKKEALEFIKLCDKETNYEEMKYLRELTEIAKAYCKKMEYEFIFANENKFGFEDKNGQMWTLNYFELEEKLKEMVVKNE